MNIHEYQAKDLLDQYKVAVPRGISAGNEAEIDSAIKSLNNSDLLVAVSYTHLTLPTKA